MNPVFTPRGGQPRAGLPQARSQVHLPLRFSGTPGPGRRAGRVRAEADGQAASGMAPQVPIAIDSEPGAPCYLDASHASLLRQGREAQRAAQPRMRRNGASD